MHRLFKNHWDCLLVYLFSGLYVMSYELLLSRIATPYLGAYLEVWCFLIGCIVLGLSLGNFVGALYFEKIDIDKIPAAMAWVLFFICAWISVLPLIFSRLLPILLQLSLTACALSFFSIFAIPTAILIGFVFPGIARRTLKNDAHIGAASAALAIVNGIGSFLGTWVLVFVLFKTYNLSLYQSLLFIQYLATALFLVLLFRYFDAKKRIVHAFAVALLLLHTYKNRHYHFHIALPNEQILDVQEDIKRSFRVANLTSSTQPTRKFLGIILPLGYIHTLVDAQDPTYPNRSPYQSMFAWVAKQNKHTEYLLLGFGGGVFARDLLREKNTKKVVAIDVDAYLRNVAEQHFAFPSDDSRFTLFEGDGRAFLRKLHQDFDAIYMDVYLDNALPPDHMVTTNFFAEAKAYLRPNGIFVMNYFGDCSSNNPESLSQKVALGLARAFAARTLLLSAPTEKGTGSYSCLLIASRDANLIKKIEAQTLYPMRAIIAKTEDWVFEDDSRVYSLWYSSLRQGQMRK